MEADSVVMWSMKRSWQLGGRIKLGSEEDQR